MKVRQLIAELKEMPQDAEVYVADDGSAQIIDWNSTVQDVNEVEGTVILEFEGYMLRQAIDQADAESAEGGDW